MTITYYIVRGIDDYLYVFYDEPVKRGYRWETKFSKEQGKIVWDLDNEFDNIKWEDEEPHKITLYTINSAKEYLKHDPELCEVRKKFIYLIFTRLIS